MQLESITIIVSTVLSTMCHPVTFVFALLALQCITAQGNVVMFNKKCNTILLSLIAIIVHFHHVYSRHNDKGCITITIKMFGEITRNQQLKKNIFIYTIYMYIYYAVILIYKNDTHNNTQTNGSQYSVLSLW